MWFVIAWNVRRECLSAAVGKEEVKQPEQILLQNHDQITLTFTHINADLFDCNTISVLTNPKRCL